MIGVIVLLVVCVLPLMLIFGQHYLTSRIAAALFGTILLAFTYAWVRRATQNGGLALATMAGLAFSFWGISSSEGRSWASEAELRPEHATAFRA